MHPKLCICMLCQDSGLSSLTVNVNGNDCTDVKKYASMISLMKAQNILILMGFTILYSMNFI